MVIPSSYPRRKKRFFRPPKASNGPMTKPFELGGLQMILSENPMSNSSGVTHIGHTSKSNVCFLQKMDKKLLYFLKQKIAVIQAKLFCVQKNIKKSRIFKSWTARLPNFVLEVNNITKVVSFSRPICYCSPVFWENQILKHKTVLFFG